jgi:(1->4)-alpha-D-glucan 1-alpha-D-glucosylmutase
VAEPSPFGRTPLATYRVQFRPEFGFDDAAAIAGYLKALGVSHLYASPYLQAAPGSTHGYDVVDPKRVNEELGGAAGHDRLGKALEAAGLGQVLDIVPNHMAITAENRWWWDVLENGPSSPYATYFDVDWDPPESKLRNTVLMPILGDHYGRILEAGDFHVERAGGTFSLRYFDHALPIAPASLDGVLIEAASRLEGGAGADDLAFIATSFRRLPAPGPGADPAIVQERHRDKEVLRRHLARLVDEEPAVGMAIDTVLAEVNADPDELDRVLERQNYRLAFWRTAGRELDYRRFFDINTLAAMRVEDEQVFCDTHELVLGFVRDGVIDGLRIDHPDGLRDPEHYLRRLHEQGRGAWVVVEKILEPGERLPSSWLVAGTTGYDFLNRVGGLFVDPAGEEPLTRLYGELTGEATDYRQLAHDTRVAVMRDVLAADISRLVAQFVEVCERHRRHRDHTRHELEEAIVEVIACFPVYRTYVRADEDQTQVRDADMHHIVEAVAGAKAHRDDLDPQLLDFLGDVLMLRQRGGTPEREFVMRFQQVTGPVMAKGVEDTAFYRYNRLVSLNEVGGDPGTFGHSPEEFHAAMAEAQASWGKAMLASSTHDTKRSEDVRARISLLSEIPERWGEVVRAWMARNERHRTDPATGATVDRNAEYLLYQVLVGAHPLSVDRATAYMEKAAKEAKAHTSWVDPEPAYDAALRRFTTEVVGDVAFQEEVARFVDELRTPGWVTSLAATLVKLTAPGVPDVYQGTELWDLSLVDPDNRRPVDYDLRRDLLRQLDGLDAEAVWARADEGLPKLHVVRTALRVRATRAAAFAATSSYAPLVAAGEHAARVVGFVRGGEVATVVPRLVLGRGGDWAGTTVALPPGRWHDELTGTRVEGGSVGLDQLLGRFPVALVTREDPVG